MRRRIRIRFSAGLVVQIRDLLGGQGKSFVSVVKLSESIEMVDQSPSHHDVLLAVAEEISQFGCFDWDMTTDVLEWTDGLLCIFGIERIDFNGKGEAFFGRVHQDDQDGMRQAIADAIRNGGRFQCAERILRPNGEVRWLESKGRLTTDAESQPTRLVGVCRDITDRVKAEQIRESEQFRFRQVTEHGGILIWEADPQTSNFTFVSQSCEKLTGYTADEWREPGFWGTLLHPDDLEAKMEFSRQVTTTRTNGRSEYRLVRKDGKVIWIEDITQVILVGEELVGLRGTLIDITERKTLQQQLLQSQKMEAIGSLTSGIAHDFNNLLTVVISSCELLEMQFAETFSDGASDLVRSIRDAGDRASRLTDQLLLFSRSSTSRPEATDLNFAVTDASEFLSRILGSGIQLSVVLGPDMLKVLIDPTHLQQTLLNFAVNSRDAMPEGGLLSIQTSKIDTAELPSYAGADDADSYVMLTVADTGDGIPAEVRSQIFDPFFTTKPVGAGTGLGLSVVYGIVNAAGGHIEVDSEVGHGTEFRIYFPIADEEEPAVASFVGDPARKGIILVVEDEPAVMQVVLRSFRQAGYDAIGIADPLEAKRFVLEAEQSIQLLVTDVSMPSMSGPDLAESLQGDPESSAFPVLYLSGNDRQMIEKRYGIVMEARNFVQKPFRIATLLDKTHELLAN